MSGVKVEVLTEPVTLGEGPHWDAEQQALFFVSIFDRTIHKYAPATGAHTRTQLDGMPTFIIPVHGQRDQFAVSLGRRAVLLHWDGEDGSPARVLRELAEVDADNPDNRFNDAKTDPKGRLYAGTMGHEYAPGQFHLKKGSLYRLERGGGARRLASGFDISNGLCWDVRESAFYFADSFEYNVRKYHYDLATGDISSPKLVLPFSAHGLQGIPDGMTIDTDGNLWIANFDGSQVFKADPRAGRVLQRVPLPALQTTSVAFGGRDLDELYVTSACMNRGAEQPPPAGALFRVTGLGVRGYAGVPLRLE